jgi:hypothetical protein|tara:strand:+ start:891 stop:4562 length:3672 start_codon:yes stop_codon:yes gene_type:complete
MANSIKTYWAKRVRIEAFRTQKFNFQLKLKNEDGSNYNIPDGHVAFFGAFEKNPGQFFSNPIYAYSQEYNYYSFPTEINENVINVSLDNENLQSEVMSKNLYVAPKHYDYVLFTYNPEDVPEITYTSEEEMPDNQYLYVSYLSPEATMVYTVYPETQNDNIGYYHEWAMMGGDSTSQPYCIEPSFAILQANTTEGQAQLSPISLYNNSYYQDSADVWNTTSFTFKSGMNQLSLIVGIQTRNISKCVYPTNDEVQVTHTWRSHYVETPNQEGVPNLTIRPQTDDFTFNTGHEPSQVGTGVFYQFNDTLNYQTPESIVEWPQGIPFHLSDPGEWGSSINNLAINSFTESQGGIGLSSDGIQPSMGGLNPISSRLTNPYGFNLTEQMTLFNEGVDYIYIPTADYYSSQESFGWWWSYYNTELFYFISPSLFMDEPIYDTPSYSWDTKGSVFYGFRDWVEPEAGTTLMNSNPEQFINTLPGIESQTFLEEDINIFFGENIPDYQKSESQFKIRLKASIINAGAASIWVQESSTNLLNIINGGENYITIEYGAVLVSDSSVEITLTKQSHIDPIFYSEAGTTEFIFDQSTETTFPILTDLNDATQNLDVVLDFNPILSDMQEQYPGQKVKLFYRYKNLVTTNPFSLMTETGTYVGFENIYEPIERSIFWEGENRFCDVKINPGDFNVYGGGTFQTGFYDGSFWDGQYFEWDTGMEGSRVDFSLKTRTASYLKVSAPTMSNDYLGSYDWFYAPHGLTPLSGGVYFGTGGNGTRYYKLVVELRNETTGAEQQMDVVIDSWQGPSYSTAPYGQYMYWMYNASTAGYAAIEWKHRHHQYYKVRDNIDYHFFMPEDFANQGDLVYIEIYHKSTHSSLIAGDNDPRGLLSSQQLGGAMGYYDWWLNGGADYGDNEAPDISIFENSITGQNFDSQYARSDYMRCTNPYVADQSYISGIPSHDLLDDGEIELYYLAEGVQLGEDEPFYMNYSSYQTTLGSQFQQDNNPGYYWEETFYNIFLQRNETKPAAYTSHRFWIQANKLSMDWTGQQVVGQTEVDIEYTNYIQFEGDSSHILNQELNIESIKTINVSKETNVVLENEGIPFSLINTFDFTFQLRRVDTNTIYYEWTRTVNLAPDDNVDFSIWENFNYFELAQTLPIENFGIPDGAELEIRITPESFRKFNNEFDGWIRLTKTEVQCTWRNYSYISSSDLFNVATKANYWLYGKFVVKNNEIS